MMKKNIALFFLLIPLIACSQEKNEQVLVLEKVFTDQSVATFFEDRDTVNVIYSSYSYLKIGFTDIISGKMVKVVDQDSAGSEKGIKFIAYETTNNHINTEIILFSKNVIYSARYERRNSEIIEVESNTTFIKSPRN